MMALRSLLLTASIFAVVATQKVIDLSGNDWTLQNPALNISVPASFPSQAHLDLYAAQVIGNPYVVVVITLNND